MIPSGYRSSIDEWYLNRQRTAQLVNQTTDSIARQQALLTAAEEALNVRKKELLGDPAREPVPNRPEFTDGLLQAIEDIEEERNQLQLNVDHLRRQINEQLAIRQERMESLTQQTAVLPGPEVE